MKEILVKYIPEAAVAYTFELIRSTNTHLRIVNQRRTRHGDYQLRPDGSHQITVNASRNRYQFLMTLIHEIAHLVAFQKYGRSIKPHGREWKHTFQKLMLPLLRPEVFPSSLLPLLALHFKNPKASSDTDARLSVAMKQYSPSNDKSYIFELPLGSVFRLHNGRVFEKGPKRIKRYECTEVSTGRKYIFTPNAEVEIIREA